MKIVKGRPPNFDEIVAAIPHAANPNVLFAYGNTIYTPSGSEISPWIVAHEEIHSMRQGADPDGWWRRYLVDKQFRFTEELVAHRCEWRTWMNMGVRNRHDKRFMMRIIAGRLSGPLYGSIVNFDAARTMIMTEAST